MEATPIRFYRCAPAANITDVKQFTVVNKFTVLSSAVWSTSHRIVEIVGGAREGGCLSFLVFFAALICCTKVSPKRFTVPRAAMQREAVEEASPKC